ncbi:YdcF family protein [Nocardia sp. CNY236]|uniref:YdcF family protein n=1 Tax=Nocardia sp. CNY236 TaxID=1169152 RepID=UPI00056465F6|nr:YdcF family protein [Nocardia sp. CNY236]
MKISRHVRFLVAVSLAVFSFTGLSSGPTHATPDTGAPYHATPDMGAPYYAAQRHFDHGDDVSGQADLRRLVDSDPHNAEALALRAIWSDYAGDIPALVDSMLRLQAVDPGLAQRTREVLVAIRAAVGTLPNPLPTLAGGHTGIVVLGYGLLPDGSLRPELENRLTAAWVQSIAAPQSPIVVTGGNPRNGITEAEAMRAWLTAHGVAATRIHVESRAGSTVQNALFTTQLLRDIGATSAVVVTSPNHIRRAVADFLVAGTRVVGAMTSLEQLVSQLPPPGRSARLGIYRDAARTFQLSMAR